MPAVPALPGEAIEREVWKGSLCFHPHKCCCAGTELWLSAECTGKKLCMLCAVGPPSHCLYPLVSAFLPVPLRIPLENAFYVSKGALPEVSGLYLIER